MEFVAGVNADLLVRTASVGPWRPFVQEAWLCFSPGRVTIVTDIHAQGIPHNAIAFTAEELREIANRIPAAPGNDSATGARQADRKPI